jgi:cytochrome c5
MNRRSLTAIIVVSLVLLGAFLAACGETPQKTTAPATEQERPAPATEEATTPATEEITEEAATPTAEQEPTVLDGQSLVEERCTQCHSLGAVTGTSKTEEEWRATVGRMVGKGADLNAEEQAAVIQYLAETYPK